MAKLDMKEYARRGAEARVAELRAELREIYRTFPGLRRLGGAAPADGDGPAEGGRARGRKRRARGRKRPEMSAAQKRAVSLRMKRYWAERRKSAKGEAAK